MRFIKSDDRSNAEKDLLDLLSSLLSEKSVLFLLSGGSNIGSAVNIVGQLDSDLTKRLNMLLADERYGLSGHKDSNYAQLISSGLDIKNATFPDILEKNASLENTAKYFSEIYTDLKQRSDVIVALLGIGDDGHIAGVLPNSPALKSKGLVSYYESPPYTRITLSLDTLKDIDHTFVFCYGKNKQAPLKRLAGGHETIDDLPSLVLSSMTGVRVYNDQL